MWPVRGKKAAGRVVRRVEREGHDAVGEVEGLFDAVAVVDIDVDVQHAVVHLQQLEDRQHDVVRVAESRCLAALRVVEPSGPVDDDVGAALVEARRARDRATRVRLTVLVQPVEDRAIVADVEALEHRAKLLLLHVLGRDSAQEVDVFVGVEGDHVLERRRLRAENVHVLIQAIVDDQVVRQPHAVGAHWVLPTVMVVANLLVIEVVDALA